MQAAVQNLEVDERFFNCDDKHEKCFEKNTGYKMTKAVSC